MLRTWRLPLVILPLFSAYVACSGNPPPDVFVGEDASSDSAIGSDGAAEDVITATGEKLCNGADVGKENPAYGCGANSCAPCVRVRSTAKCVQGACAIDKCDDGYGSCDGKAGNGCELDLRESVDNCGACGVTCVGGEVCNVGKCSKGCDNGLAACNGACFNLQTSDAHCGKCGNACSAISVANAKPSVCAAGVCKIECNQGFLLCPKGNTCEGSKPAVIELVLDASGSMSENNKWAVTQNAALSFIASLKSLGRSDLYVGLMIFSDSKDCTNGAGPYPTTASAGGCVADIPVALLDATQEQKMTARLNTTIGGPSPVFAALKGGHAAVGAFATAPVGAAKSVVLMTDGSPNDANAATILQFMATQTAAYTYVIGVQGSGYEPAFLSDLAVAGRTRNSATCTNTGPKYTDYCHTTVESSKPTFMADAVAALGATYERATRCN